MTADEQLINDYIEAWRDLLNFGEIWDDVRFASMDYMYDREYCGPDSWDWVDGPKTTLLRKQIAYILELAAEDQFYAAKERYKELRRQVCRIGVDPIQILTERKAEL